jgi:hypothetical protein
VRTYWLRLYTEILHDPKIRGLSADEFRGWIFTLLIAKEHDQNGMLPDEETIIFALRVQLRSWHRLRGVLLRRGLLDRLQTTEGERFKIHGWEARQYKSDTSADRMKRYRERQNAVTCDVTPTVTVTRSENREQRTEKTPPSPPSSNEPPVDSDTRIMALVESWPTPKGRQVGLHALAQTISESANPEATLRGMESVWPGWVRYHAANEERFRPRLDRFVRSLDWMHRAPPPGQRNGAAPEGPRYVDASELIRRQTEADKRRAS